MTSFFSNSAPHADSTIWSLNCLTRDGAAPLPTPAPGNGMSKFPIMESGRQPQCPFLEAVNKTPHSSLYYNGRNIGSSDAEKTEP